MFPISVRGNQNTKGEDTNWRSCSSVGSLQIGIYKNYWPCKWVVMSCLS